MPVMVFELLFSFLTSTTIISYPRIHLVQSDERCNVYINNV